MKFTKMHGLGNDYLYVYSDTEPQEPEALSKQLSDRHFGAGSDGMIWILPSRIADYKMRIFNADGSEAAMCGNGIRCVGKYLYDKGYTNKTHLEIETLAGIKTLALHCTSGTVTEVSVNMGKALVSAPITVSAANRSFICNPISMGNPHAVIFTENAESEPLEATGPCIEHADAFPGGVNVEFVTPLDRHTLRMRVWERGSGITMACGTGACAAAAAAAAHGLCPYAEDIAVILDGGTLHIQISPDNTVTMTGPAAMIYEGETIE